MGSDKLKGLRQLSFSVVRGEKTLLKDFKWAGTVSLQVSEAAKKYFLQLSTHKGVKHSRILLHQDIISKKKEKRKKVHNWPLVVL